MDWARGKITRGMDKVSEETDGVQSKRERAKIFGNLVAHAAGRGAQSVGGAVLERAQTTHDALTEMRHEQKQPSTSTLGGYTGGEAGTTSTGSESAFGPKASFTSVLRVEVLAAVDLSEKRTSHTAADWLPQTFAATCDAYAAVAIGPVGMSWAAKLQWQGKEAATRVMPRKRHPRWNTVLTLPLPSSRQPLELMLRVLDSHTLSADTPLGEIRIGLEGQPVGGGCFRLLGSGFASVSLRWMVTEAQGSYRVFSSGGTFPPAGVAFEHVVGFWSAHEDEPEQAVDTLIAVFEDCDAKRANELIMHAPLSALLQVGPRSSGDLLHTFGSILPLLKAPAKSRLVGALVELISAKSGTSPSAEHLLFNVFRGTAGLDLSKLKRLVDTNGTRYDLLHTITTSITDLDKHVELVSHFAQEAEGIVERPIHVMSDIDMTVWIGHFGNCGPKFPIGRVPGALPLYRELGCQITFLTARPQAIEASTRRKLLEEMDMADAAVLQGDIGTVLKTLIWRKDAHRAMGSKKTANFCDFSTMHPEARFIFVGDSGEGDVDFGKSFVMATDGSSELRTDRVALIHDVVNESGLHPKTSVAERAELAAQNVQVFDTFAGAALVLHKHGFLSPEGLHAAGTGCQEEFAQLDGGKFASDSVYFARQRELVRDLASINEALVESVQYGAEAPLIEITAGAGGEIPWWKL